MHLSKVMPMMTPLYNPYTMYQGYNNMTGGYNQNYQPVVDSQESVLNFIESYLSLDNLNQDLYLRNRIDDNGFIEVSEIANHNKLRKGGVSVETISRIFGQNDNPIVEAFGTESGVFLRNRDWENIKDKLLSKEVIQQQKRMLKTSQYVSPMNTMNYVSMQNNYFFNGMPTSGENFGMYMGYHPVMNMSVNPLTSTSTVNPVNEAQKGNI